MSDQDETKKKSSEVKPEGLIIDKTRFGGLTPLTAVQIVSLLIKSDMAFGACACGGACGGPCY